MSERNPFQAVEIGDVAKAAPVVEAKTFAAAVKRGAWLGFKWMTILTSPFYLIAALMFIANLYFTYFVDWPEDWNLTERQEFGFFQQTGEIIIGFLIFTLIGTSTGVFVCVSLHTLKKLPVIRRIGALRSSDGDEPDQITAKEEKECENWLQEFWRR